MIWRSRSSTDSRLRGAALTGGADVFPADDAFVNADEGFLGAAAARADLPEVTRVALTVFVAFVAFVNVAGARVVMNVAMRTAVRGMSTLME